MLMDDNEALASIIIDGLRAAGLDACWGPLGERGLIRALGYRPDLLFLGLRGDGGDRAQVAALRGALAPAGCRIIGVLRDRQRAPRPEVLGLDALFVAPLDPEALGAAYRVVAGAPAR